MMSERKIATIDDVINMMNEYANFCNSYNISIDLMVMIRDWHIAAYEQISSFIDSHVIETIEGKEKDGTL